jgi:pimeloyl-ACP methyl ester carboxylesterase
VTSHNQHYVHANGLQIAYEVYGAGPPLILIHGGLGTAGDWHAHSAAFAERFQVFAPDSRGHGRTDNPAGHLNYRAMAGDVAAFADALGLQKPLIYGYSDGGQIALEVAMQYPGMARAVVASAAALTLSDRARVRVEELMGNASEPNVDLEAVEAVLGDYVHDLRRMHAPVYGEGYLQEFLNQSKALWLTQHDYTAVDLQRIAVPMLILLGDRDESITVEEAVEMYRMIPAAELAIVPATNHSGAGDSKVVTGIVLDFLKRHSPSTD